VVVKRRKKGLKKKGSLGVSQLGTGSWFGGWGKKGSRVTKTTLWGKKKFTGGDRGENPSQTRRYRSTRREARGERGGGKTRLGLVLGIRETLLSFAMGRGKKKKRKEKSAWRLGGGLPETHTRGTLPEK